MKVDLQGGPALSGRKVCLQSNGGDKSSTLPCELGVACRAKYVCSFTATSVIPSVNKSVSSRPEERKRHWLTSGVQLDSELEAKPGSEG